MLKGKRILITQPIIRGFNGSTLVTLELAKTLQSYGALVTVYTCDYAEPAKTHFSKNHIKIDTAQDNPNYKLADFDYVWVHSQILPLSLITALSHKLPPKIPEFIFLHMSGMDWIPDEKPWIYDLENQLSSLSLFISEEVLAVNRALLKKTVPTAFFRNPAPHQYLTRKNPPNPKLKNLLIVSSHPPKEVLETKTILIEKYGVNVKILGEDQDEYKLFTNSILEQYDAILTIAKTVPYCLVSGTPVYVYDIYGGGPGWLNHHNFEEAKKRNFSGYQNSFYPNFEGGVFHRKTASQIADEIVNGYSSSLLYHQENRQNFIKDFSIDEVLPKLFAKIHPRNIKPFSTVYAESVIAAERFATVKFETGGLLYVRDDYIRSQAKKQEKLIKQNAELTAYKDNAEQVFNSKAYKLFQKLIKPYKAIKNISNK